MKNNLLRLRYYLEIIAVPAFIFLVVHLSGHGLLALLNEEHDHSHHNEVQIGQVDHPMNLQEILKSLLTVEVLGGMLLLILFTWLWHRPALKKWIPCSHDCCKNETTLPHILAIIALCLHFFPEAGIRHELLHQALEGETVSILGFIGFAAHFLVDIIVAIILSSYWETKRGFWLSLLAITVVWLLALFVAEHVGQEDIPHSAESVISLLSAFLLCMFIHKPHKPVCSNAK